MSSGNLPEVVRYDNNTTVELVDGVGERVDGGDIETVGRLVKQKHVRLLDSEQSEDDTCLLAFGQSAHLSLIHI